jgi:hypothetical protein
LYRYALLLYVACSFGPLTCRAASLVLAEDNTYTGHDNQRGNPPARKRWCGRIKGDVRDNGTLAFDRSDMMSFAGVISGSGAVSQSARG